jgi:3-oxoadipate enol-lactonase
MPAFSINGIDCYYESRGEGPALVFAHGVGGNHASWFQQVPFFSRWYRTVTFDHRGFGNSDDIPEGPGRSAFVDDLEALIDGLGIEDVALVAQSMGGWTMLGYSLRHPGRVKALIMADTLGGITAPGPLADLQAATGARTRNLPQLERVVAPGYAERNPVQAGLYLQIASFNVADRFNLRGDTGVAPSPAEVARLNVPILFLVGAQDVLHPVDEMRMAHEAIPGSTLAVVEGAGHSVYFEAPDVFNHEVRSFLLRHGYPGAAG